MYRVRGVAKFRADNLQVGIEKLSALGTRNALVISTKKKNMTFYKIMTFHFLKSNNKIVNNIINYMFWHN